MSNLILKYGSWALITGASSGIGKEFARRLSSEGFNLILIARRKDRLDALSIELKNLYPVEIVTVEQDLTEDNFLENIILAAKDKEIGMLVNNAGIGSNGEFINADPEVEEKMVKLNCVAPLALTHYFLNQMKVRKKGAIIFLGSVVAFQPTPFMSTYAATKAFNSYLGDALWWELKKYNIDVLTLNPGGTATEFQRIADTSTGPIPRTTVQVVNTAFKALGKKPGVVDGFFNKIMAVSSRLTSKKYVVMAAGIITEKLYKNKTKTKNPSLKNSARF